MSKDQKKTETMLHPFTKVACEVMHLQPGALLEPGDIYRSVTIAEDGMAITPESGGIGRWFQASNILEGSVVHAECNVHFIRLLPLHPELDEELPDEEYEKHLLMGGHAIA